MRYNYRDQLVLTGGSDSKVILLNAPSVASEPLVIEDETDELQEKEEKVTKVDTIK